MQKWLKDKKIPFDGKMKKNTPLNMLKEHFQQNPKKKNGRKMPHIYP
jgi:hypothetical protein